MRDSGPQLTLIQLLPSSTVADGIRLKRGFGVTASLMPGGTPKPCGPPHPSARVHSGGTREPLQYAEAKLGVPPISEFIGCRLNPEAWLGPVLPLVHWSPRTPMSHYAAVVPQLPVAVWTGT